MKVPPHDKTNFQDQVTPSVRITRHRFTSRAIPKTISSFWLAAAAEEQKARHAWVFAEQKIRAEEWRGQRHNKLISMLLGLILAATLILTGTYLINQGHSLSGYFWALLGAAWLVSAAIFGFRPTQTPASELDSNSPTPPH
jgi:uncharacterized membrane protein